MVTHWSTVRGEKLDQICALNLHHNWENELSGFKCHETHWKTDASATDRTTANFTWLNLALDWRVRSTPISKCRMKERLRSWMYATPDSWVRRKYTKEGKGVFFFSEAQPQTWNNLFMNQFFRILSQVDKNSPTQPFIRHEHRTGTSQMDGGGLEDAGLWGYERCREVKSEACSNRAEAGEMGETKGRQPVATR